MSYVTSAGRHGKTAACPGEPPRLSRTATIDCGRRPIACFSSSASTQDYAKTAAPIAGTTEHRSSADLAQIVTADDSRPAKRGSARSGLKQDRSPATVAERPSRTIHTSHANDVESMPGRHGMQHPRVDLRASRQRAYAPNAGSRSCLRRDTAGGTGSAVFCDIAGFPKVGTPSSGTGSWLRTSAATTRGSRWSRASTPALITAFRAAEAATLLTSTISFGVTGKSTLSRMTSLKPNSLNGAGRSQCGSVSGQGSVPHDADAAERARERLLLRLVGVCPAPVCRPHTYRIARLIESCGSRAVRTNVFSCSTAGRTRFLPGLKAEASSGGLGD
jgi:hypothetical protein